jgi:hypothetical protein
VLESHARPQPPQLSTLVCVLVQTPVQQLSDDVHALPHSPQCEEFVAVVTHAPPQHC